MPPIRSMAARASSRSATGMISTSSPTTWRALAMSFSPCAVGTRKYFAPDCNTADAFDVRPTDRTDLATSMSIAAGHGHALAAEQVAVRQLVDQRQGERQPGRRSADRFGVDLDRHVVGKVDGRRVGREEADDRAVGSSGAAISSTSPLPGSPSRSYSICTVSPGLCLARIGVRSSTTADCSCRRPSATCRPG